MLPSGMPGAAPPLGGYTLETLLSAPKHEPLSLHLRLSGRPLHLRKARGESVQHLLLKGLLWALLLPSHPEAACERDLGLRYRPDVVALDGAGTPCWWGECGSVKASKLRELSAAFPRTRVTIAKWGRTDLRGYGGTLKRELALPNPRAAPFELVSFPADSVERFLSEDGELAIGWDDVVSTGLVDVLDPD